MIIRPVVFNSLVRWPKVLGVLCESFTKPPYIQTAKMSFWQWSRMMDKMMDDYMRDLARHSNQVAPYWRDADHSVLQIANDAHQVVDDDKRFAVSIDVSQFKPEELKVNLDGRQLTVEGKQEHRDEHSFMGRSFIRSWTLPEEVDLEALKTELSDKGKLTIEAPKNKSSSTKKNIPIMAQREGDYSHSHR